MAHFTGDRNWEKGIPFSRLIDSALRHINQFRQGKTDEDHLAQSLWNLACIIHFQEEGRTDLDDLPKYVRRPKPPVAIPTSSLAP